jgi:chemotaxis protein MotB
MSAKKSKHEEEHEEEASERWLLTYADMITLLMVLFIVLFSIGQVDLKKFEQLREGLTESFGTPSPALDNNAPGTQGVLDGGVAAAGEDLTAEEIAQVLESEATRQATIREEQQQLVETQENIQGTLEGQGLGDEVTYRLEGRGLVLNIVSDQVLFDLGRADLKPEGQLVLDGVANALRQIPNTISIEGHTDNRPLNGGLPYPTNWELSTGRATSVLRYFLEQHGIDGGRMSAAGYADQQPLVPNDNGFNQARNRRVEIVVLTTAEEALSRLQQDAAADGTQEGTP